MISISVNDWRAYIELEVYGQYDPARFPEIVAAARTLVAKHGHYSLLVVHHGRVENMLSAARKWGAEQTSGKKPDDFSFMSKLRRYALVADEPGLIMRLTSLFGNAGATKMKIFPAHERDAARVWVEAGFNDGAVPRV